MSRVIKFRVIRFNDKGPYILGYERLNDAGDWEWMCLDLNPDKGERWTPGVLVTGYTYKRSQFTGLFYKDGTEVYEGDLLKNKKGWLYEVRWINAAFHAVKISKNYIGPRHAALTQRVTNSCEKIGNIYQHKHLLA